MTAPPKDPLPMTRSRFAFAVALIVSALVMLGWAFLLFSLVEGWGT